jgi:23S rRNA (uracil1939-C5)-methyltransferase
MCGGCRWQNLSYEKQLYYKNLHVIDSFERIAKVKIEESMPILPAEKTYFYRNKLEYTFSARAWLTKREISEGKSGVDGNALGFHVPRFFDRIFDVQECLLQEEPSNDIRLFFKKECELAGLSFQDIRGQFGCLRNLMIRTTSTGEVMVILIVRDTDTEKIKKILDNAAVKFPGVVSWMYAINPKSNDSYYDLQFILHNGKDHILEILDGVKFRIGPKSFFQTNSDQAKNLYRFAIEMAGLSGKESVYDLYTGTGSIALYASKHCAKVTGIETVSEAIEDAWINAELNGIKNVSFHVGDVLKVLDDAFISEHGKPDVIITDPPRAGMHEMVVEKMMEIAPDKIVYISCNPATQARDIALMSEKYEVKKIQPVDMFPQTVHVENVALLVRK